MAGHDTGTVIMSHAPSLKNHIKENEFMHSVGIVLLALVMRVLRVRVLLVLVLVLLSVNSEYSTSNLTQKFCS